MTSKLYYLNMNTTTKQQESVSEIKRRRTANRNAAVIISVLFVALLTGSGATNAPNGELGVRDIVWGSLSVAAFAGLLWSLYISYRQADERQQIIQLKATSLAFVGIIFGMVTAQILHALAIVSLHTSIQIVIIGGVLLWMTLLKQLERHTH